MKLKSLTPNAHYDMVHGIPSAIERDNDGSFIYRLNITPEYDTTGSTGDEDKQIGWSCFETRCWGSPTQPIIERAVTRNVVADYSEVNLVNSYNKHILGIEKDEKAVRDYKEYLQFTSDLSTQIASDLAKL